MRSLVSRRGAPVVGRKPGWLAIAWAFGLVAAPQAWPAPPPALPQRNLVIEWRQLDESLAMTGQQGAQGHVVSTTGGVALSGGVTLSTQRRDEQRTQSQQLRVLNGGRASVRVGHSVPLTWVQAAQAEPQSGGFNQPAAGAGVVQGLTWLEAGRQIVLQPRWPGGSQPAVVDVQVDSAALDAERPGMPAATVGSALPVQSRSQTVTTVLAPLGQWVTIARTGGEQVVEQPGSVSTLSSGAQRQLMQIRVMAP